MGIKISVECDRCGLEWEDHNIETINSYKTLFIPPIELAVKGHDIVLCDQCMAEYDSASDMLRWNFGIPIKKGVSPEQIKVEGIVESHFLTEQDKEGIAKLIEMRKIQMNVPMKE